MMSDEPRSNNVHAAIRNDIELAVTRERISYFMNLLERLSVSSRPEELAAVTSGYRYEIERMEREVKAYETR